MDTAITILYHEIRKPLQKNLFFNIYKNVKLKRNKEVENTELA